MNVYEQGLLASLIAGLSTSIGSLISFLPVYYINRYNGVLLGFCAGLMLSATVFSLLLPAIEYSTHQLHFSKVMASLAIGVSMLFGWVIFVLLHHVIHFHDLFHKSLEKRKLWLFIMAITIHNVPEGMTVGISYFGDKLIDGIAVTTGITLQNIPEGIAIASTLISLGYSKLFAIALTLLPGLAEPIGAIFSLELINISHKLLPFIMAFAAGIMLTVITEDIITEAYKQQNRSRHVTLFLLLGFLTMMFLDLVFD